MKKRKKLAVVEKGMDIYSTGNGSISKAIITSVVKIVIIDPPGHGQLGGNFVAQGLLGGFLPKESICQK